MNGNAGLILVVEDDRNLREPLEHLLRQRDFEVMTADTANDAVNLVRTRTPDAAIVDLHLREGSGRDVVVQMPSAAPVIIFSGSRRSSGQLETTRPLTRLVEKPCSLVWLIDTLDQMRKEAKPAA
jgi:DNA-binding response OmpR family regulator